jgi:hypothetical protein
VTTPLRSETLECASQSIKPPNPSVTSYLSCQSFRRWMPTHENDHESRTAAADSTTATAGALDHLLHSKSRILRTKLEVLASEIQARFAMWDRNLDRIGNDKGQVETLLNESSRLARYHLREPNEATRLRESSLQLDTATAGRHPVLARCGPGHARFP